MDQHYFVAGNLKLRMPRARNRSKPREEELPPSPQGCGRGLLARMRGTPGSSSLCVNTSEAGVHGKAGSVRHGLPRNNAKIPGDCVTSDEEELPPSPQPLRERLMGRGLLARMQEIPGSSSVREETQSAPGGRQHIPRG